MAEQILIITQQGRDLILDGINSGNYPVISHIAAGSTPHDVSVDADGYAEHTELQGEEQRVAIQDSRRRGDNRINISAVFDGNTEFDAYSVGLLTADGTLMAIYASSTDVAFVKTPETRIAVSRQLVWAQLPAESINVENDGPPLQLIHDAEFAELQTAIARLTLDFENEQEQHEQMDSRLDAVEQKNTEQDGRLSNLETYRGSSLQKDSQQDAALALLKQRADETDDEQTLQDQRLTHIEQKNAQQDDRLNDLVAQRSAGSTLLPDGRIFAWGVVVSSSDASQRFDFPDAFPNQCYGVWLNRTEPGGATNLGASAWDAAGFNINRNSAIDGSENVNYFAIGQ